MILVDKEIKKRNEEIFISGYDEANVTAISYDLTLDTIILDEKESIEYKLKPGEMVFIKTKEKIKIPLDLMGTIGEKNSKMRLGILVSGPHYYPGHETFLFLRVQNISPNIVTIKNGDKIAQIFFEQLICEPDIPYNKQTGASFNLEDEYRGFGNYYDEYNKRIEKLENAKNELEKKESGIYANILTLMGIFVSIFSLIMVNFTNISDGKLTKEFIIPMNLSLGVCVSLFIGLILIFLNKAKNKWFLFGYFALMLFLTILLLIVI